MSATMSPARTSEEMMTTALLHLRAAIDLLDRADAPGQIAAHVDLACHQLEDLVRGDSRVSSRGREEAEFETVPPS